jgi:hypothetical protein
MPGQPAYKYIFFGGAVLRSSGTWALQNAAQVIRTDRASFDELECDFSNERGWLIPYCH